MALRCAQGQTLTRVVAKFIGSRNSQAEHLEAGAVPSLDGVRVQRGLTPHTSECPRVAFPAAAGGRRRGLREGDGVGAATPASLRWGGGYSEVPQSPRKGPWKRWNMSP